MRNSFGIGDVVTYGKSNTEWEITEETEKSVYTLKSAKGSTKRNVSWDKLTLVRDAAPVLTDAQVEGLDETYAEHGMPAAQELKTEMLTANDEFMLSIDGDGTEPDITETAQDIAVSASTGLVLIVDGHAVRDGKSFDTLAFELSRLAGTYKRAAIARNGYAVVERKAV